MALADENAARFARVGHVRRVHQGYSAFLDPARDLFDADVHILGQLLDVQAFIFAEMLHASLVILLELLVTIIADVAEILVEQLPAFWTVG